MPKKKRVKIKKKTVGEQKVYLASEVSEDFIEADDWKKQPPCYQYGSQEGFVPPVELISCLELLNQSQLSKERDLKWKLVKAKVGFLAIAKLKYDREELADFIVKEQRLKMIVSALSEMDGKNPPKYGKSAQLSCWVIFLPIEIADQEKLSNALMVYQKFDWLLQPCNFDGTIIKNMNSQIPSDKELKRVERKVEGIAKEKKAEQQSTYERTIKALPQAAQKEEGYLMHAALGPLDSFQESECKVTNAQVVGEEIALMDEFLIFNRVQQATYDEVAHLKFLNCRDEAKEMLHSLNRKGSNWKKEILILNITNDKLEAAYAHVKQVIQLNQATSFNFVLRQSASGKFFATCPCPEIGSIEKTREFVNKKINKPKLVRVSDHSNGHYLVVNLRDPNIVNYLKSLETYLSKMSGLMLRWTREALQSCLPVATEVEKEKDKDKEKDSPSKQVTKQQPTDIVIEYLNMGL